MKVRKSRKTIHKAKNNVVNPQNDKDTATTSKQVAKLWIK